MRKLLLTAGVLLSLLLTSCSGSDDNSGAASTTSSADVATTVSATTGASEPAATTTVADGATGVARPSTGCDAPTGEAAELAKTTMTVEGKERFYLLAAPTAVANKPLPVVVDFHGLSEGAAIHSTMTQFGPLALKEGFIAAFPNGSGTPVGWAAQTNSDANGDRAFTNEMLDQLEAERCVDTSRIYATGLSNGAFMSSTMGCAEADRFAAIAPVAGVQFGDPCQTDRPVPLLTFHGTDDPILLFNGGVDSAYLTSVLSGDGAVLAKNRPYDLDGAGYPAAVRAWAEHNGCDPDPKVDALSESVSHRVYSCPEGAAVEFYVIIGGGHSWPGSAFSKAIESVVGPTTSEIDATMLIWEFFQRFQLPAG